ncbi:MAG: multidrug effflux MFS transporter [Alphaproteobacteria bacterium]|nr:multidrug effflux MFS transporter [Alphaproteobacteria bacterium]MCB9929638.1 multidrug effflux MFS transporter [Alphaproteobacteria bacterium]
MLRKESLAVIILLTGLTGITPLSIDMPLAGLPALAADFNVPEARAQLVVGVFLAGFAIAQLLLGPTSDRIGRRPVLLAGLAVYGAMGVVCMQADSLAVLLPARFVQGVAACAAPVVARAIVADIYDGKAAQRAMSIVTAGMGVAPIAAPMIGGALLTWFDWTAVFFTLALTGAIMLALVLVLLGETLPARDPRAMRFGRIAFNYGEMVGNRTFLSFALPSMLASGALFSFIPAAPFVLIGQFGYPPAMFGVFFAMVMIGFITGASLSARLSRTRSATQMVRLGTTVSAVGGVLMVAGAAAGIQHALTLVLPMAVIMHGTGLMRPNSVTGAMAPFRDRAGAASALLGFLQMGGGVLAGLVAAVFATGAITLLPSSLAIGGFAVLPALFFRLYPPRAT